jgi:hypothetical protein
VTDHTLADAAHYEAITWSKPRTRTRIDFDLRLAKPEQLLDSTTEHLSETKRHFCPRAVLSGFNRVDRLPANMNSGRKLALRETTRLSKATEIITYCMLHAT